MLRMAKKAALIVVFSFYGLCLMTMVSANTDVLAQAKSMLSKENPTYLIDTAVPFFFSHFGDERLADLLNSVWEKDKKKYPDLAWQSLNDEEVRLKFANLWAQWIRETQRDKSKISEIRKFVLPYLKHSNPRFRLAAVTFTVGATDSDVEQLVKIIQNDERVIAAAAIYSVVDIQGSRAKKTLTKIYDGLSDTWLKETISRAIKDADKPQFQGNRRNSN